ncbi:unnamed protein product [Meganyctiphanes norvegica]|uniref:BZIP domain-containing protein n=1 Tax=Meganyctiphanes norvegica TaxID=48144 RepID=A0AAV2RZG3_MEGNR
MGDTDDMEFFGEFKIAQELEDFYDNEIAPFGFDGGHNTTVNSLHHNRKSEQQPIPSSNNSNRTYVITDSKIKTWQQLPVQKGLTQTEPEVVPSTSKINGFDGMINSTMKPQHHPSVQEGLMQTVQEVLPSTSNINQFDGDHNSYVNSQYQFSVQNGWTQHYMQPNNIDRNDSTLKTQPQLPVQEGSTQNKIQAEPEVVPSAISIDRFNVMNDSTINFQHLPIQEGLTQNTVLTDQEVVPSTSNINRIDVMTTMKSQHQLSVQGERTHNMQAGQEVVPSTSINRFAVVKDNQIMCQDQFPVQEELVHSKNQADQTVVPSTSNINLEILDARVMHSADPLNQDTAVNSPYSQVPVQNKMKVKKLNPSRLRIPPVGRTPRGEVPLWKQPKPENEQDQKKWHRANISHQHRERKNSKLDEQAKEIEHLKKEQAKEIEHLKKENDELRTSNKVLSAQLSIYKKHFG